MKKYISKIKKNLCLKFYTLNPNAGVSLVEFITAISIFIIAATIITSVFFSVFQASRKSSAVQNIIEETRFIMEIMSKEIRTGYNFSQPGTGDTIQFTNAEGKTIGYQKNLTNNTIEKCEITPPAICLLTDFSEITSSQIKVDNLSFILSGQIPSDSFQPKITISITVSNKGNKAEFISSIILQTTISQRKLDI